MRLLSLDLGTRRTGCAFCDTENGIALPIGVIPHQSMEECVEKVGEMVRERKIDRLIVGLPLLLSGKEGSQSSSVKDYVLALQTLNVPIEMMDERYTTPKGGSENDMLAALSILQSYMASNNI